MNRKRWVLSCAAVLAVAVVIGAVVVPRTADNPVVDEQARPANTAQVEHGQLSAVVSQTGTLTYRARPDGSPYSVINQAIGIYTELPHVAAKVDCGDALYRVDQRPVLLLCGMVPAYRALRMGDAGQDVRQLNRNLHDLGYDARAGVRIDPDDNDFTARTEKALALLQRRKGVNATGVLAEGDAVFLPESVRVGTVSAEPGAPARVGAPVLSVTSDTLHVQVDFDASQQGQVSTGDRAEITLPGYQRVAGKVVGFGRVAQVPAGQDATAAEATIPTFISFEDPSKARGFDRAPVQVDIITAGVESALSVPVTALIGKSGGGFAIEVLQSPERRELVPVTVGLFDTADGRVQVEGDLREGDHVVVPSL